MERKGKRVVAKAIAVEAEVDVSVQEIGDDR